PLRGASATSPSASSFWIASRTGVRLTLRRRARSLSTSRSFGFSSPWTMSSRTLSQTFSVSMPVRRARAGLAREAALPAADDAVDCFRGAGICSLLRSEWRADDDLFAISHRKDVAGNRAKFNSIGECRTLQTDAKRSPAGRDDLG